MPDMPYRQFLDRVADGFFLHDDQGRLLDVNVQACTRLGYDRQALLGMSVQDIDRHTLHEMRTALWQGMAPDSQTIVVSRLRRSDASSFPVEIHLSCQWLDGRRLFFAIARDISERVRQDGQGRSLALSATVQDLFEREDAHARIEALADNLPNGAIYRLEGGLNHLRLSYISAGIENLIGVPAHAIMADRQVYLDAIHPEDLPLYQQMMQSSVDTLSVFDCRFRVLKPDGEIRWLRCRSAPRRCNEGMVWDGIMLDITREREAEQALRQAKEAAEAAERAKSDFLATMSHEIRTPMNTVIGMTRLVQQTALTSRQRVYLEKVERAASALLAVINDILDFSKIEAGMLVLEEVDFTLDDVLETVSASTALRAEEKGLEVVYAMDPCLPRRLRGDPLRLGQVLTNLVGNAIKFTEHGEVVVSIHLMPPPAPTDANTDADAAAPTAAHRLCVSVRDTGIGLDASRAERLFEPFTQADTQTTRRHGGTGLGLAICHRLVQLMGGEIGVSSQPGRGSSFRFTAKVRPATDGPQCAPADLDGTRVLIVDDNDSARDALAAMVRKLGMRCDTAADGTQALRMLQEALRQESPYGLALLDWHMPGMDGRELARRIRGQRHLAATPAAFMATAFGCDEAQRHAAQLGLRGLLIKPLTASALQASIREALQDPASHQAENPAAGPPPQQRYPGLPGRRVLVVDDNALNREVATELLEQAGISVQTAVDGLQALQLLDSQPFDAVLMDVYMPGMDGLSAARAIRARSALRHLPVIALTAQAHEKDRAHIEAAGMNAYLTKPVDEVLLYETLQRCLPAAGPGPAALSKPSPSSTAPAPARLRQRLAGHAPRMRHVIEGFAQDFASAPQRLRDAARSGDWEAVAALAHTFKGSLGYLGADLLVRWSAMVETGARANLPGDGDRGDARPVGDMESLVQALADGLQGLLAEIAELSSGDALPTLPASSAAQAPPQQPPVNAGEAPTTPARLQLQIADSDYAALADQEQLRPLIGERHALTDPELPTVLIVDDERLNRSLLAELLAPHYRVLLAEDGPGALVIANREAHRLQLILLDVAMPGMNGYEVLGALRAQERTAHIAVIFITGQSNAEAEEYGLRLGAADYVSKPIRPAVVEVRVRNQVRLALQRQALERLAMVDGLTGLANRRHFDDMLERAHRRSLRTGESLGLALIDIDHFKQYNDCYGHVQGDEALKAVAATLQRHARRPYDLAARFGGEEFALILPGESDAPAMAEHFRQEVLRLRIAHAASPTAPQLTVSCGVLTVRQPSCAPLEAWLQKVDGLLYQAKTWGRNRIAAAMEP